MFSPHIQRQRGGTLLGFVLGLVIGLTVALGVAMYVTKVPMPFSNKNLSRSAEQDAVEAQKNKDWNPNGALQTKPLAAPTAPGAGPEGAEPAHNGAPANGTPAAASNPAVNPPVNPPAVSADPLNEAAKNKASPPVVNSSPSTPPAPKAATPAQAPSGNSASAPDPFTYFVQAGAFKSAADADAQKAKLSMMGIEAKVSEREQAGRTIYRVRSGPFDDKDQAEKVKARLDSSGMDAALVRVQR
jgi:cell division protein FtsN